MRFGYCVNMLAKDRFGVGYEWIETLPELGFDYVELPIAQMMAMPEAEFRTLVLTPLRNAGLPCACANNLFPAQMRLTGETADHGAAAEYCRGALSRIAQLGAHKTVFGSSGARNVPAGFSRAEAHAQLVQLLRTLEPIAAQNDVSFVIEPLNRAESNIVNTFSQGAALSRAADVPHTKLLADYYHMALAGDGVEALRAGGEALRHVHIARPLGRGLPTEGDGEDYGAFFRALRDVGYDAELSIEAYADSPEEIRRSLAYLRRCAA